MVAKRHFDSMNAEANYVQAFASSFDSAASTGDLTVLCDGTAIKCHKYVVSRRSEHLKAVIESDEFRDGNASSIDLQDETDHAAVHAMLEFCYSVNYTTPVPDNSLFHIHIYALAEKFIIADLRQLATDRFREVAETEDDASLAHSIREAYAITTDTDKILKRTIIEIVLMKARNVHSITALVALADELPAYAVDLARGALKQIIPRKRKYACPGGCAGGFEKALIPSEMYTHYCGTHRKANEWTMSEWQWNTIWGRDWITD